MKFRLMQQDFSLIPEKQIPTLNLIWIWLWNSPLRIRFTMFSMPMQICSLLRNMEEEGVSVGEADLSVLNLLEQPQEIALIRHLAALPSRIDAAAASYDPSEMTKYATELATLFHKFYDACTVKHAEPELQQARLLLCQAAKQALRNTLRILKIDCPEKM